MRIIVIGAGFTGVQIVRRLLAERHEVVLIDRDADRVRDIGNQLDCTVLHSEGNSLEALERAGLASADVLIAVAASDEVNLVACALAGAAHPKVLKIARARNYAYYAAVQGAAQHSPFGIDWLVNPDVEAARAVLRALDCGAIGSIVGLGRGYGIVTLSVGASSPLDGRPLRRLNEVGGWHYLVAHVEGPLGTRLPDGDTVLGVGDRIGVLAKLDDVSSVAALCGAGAGNVSRTVIVGASRIGSFVVEGQRNRKVRRMAVVDESMDRCRALAERFRDVQVLCGDATDNGLVLEEGLGECDLAVAVSENFDRNLITAGFLKARGVGRTVALASNADVSDIAERLGIDVVVPMRETVADSILGHLRGRNVTAVHTVCGGAFEIVECEVNPSGAAAGKALRDLKLAGAGLVLMVYGSDGVGLVPRGDTVVPGGAGLVLIVPSGDGRAVRAFSE